MGGGDCSDCNVGRDGDVVDGDDDGDGGNVDGDDGDGDSDY